jgi:hypothetical protein
MKNIRGSDAAGLLGDTEIRVGLKVLRGEDTSFAC